MFSEYVGLSQDVASLIEAHRTDSSETKNDVLRRILPRSRRVDEPNDKPFLDFSQGIQLPAGERLYLYLSKPNSIDQKPDGLAEVRADGLYLEGKKVTPSHGSVLAPAMQQIQRRLGHLNSKGDPISLSAFRQWHVVRDGQLVALDQLKDPDQRRTRTPKASKVDVEALLAELGIK